MKKTIITITLALVASVGMGQVKPKSDSLSKGADSIVSWGTATATTNGGNYAIAAVSWPKMYTIDWRKVKTFSDLKKVMSGINIYITGDYKNFNQIKKYLIQTK